MKRHHLSVFALALLFSVDAFAYLDPGTGSMILQGIIAGVAIGWLTIKTYWYKLASLFGKKPASSLLEDDPETEDTNS
jgi:hypothetical protein